MKSLFKPVDYRDIKSIANALVSILEPFIRLTMNCNVFRVKRTGVIMAQYENNGKNSVSL